MMVSWSKSAIMPFSFEIQPLGNLQIVRHQGFFGSRADIARGDWSVRPGMTRHQRQEREANRFAIELLAPAHRLKPYTSKKC